MHSVAQSSSGLEAPGGVVPATSAGDLRNVWLVAVARSRRLTPGQRLVLVTLHFFSNWDTGSGARPGADMLAAASGQSVRNVRKALEAAEAAGYVRAVRRGGGRKVATVYRLTLPEEEVAPALVSVGRDPGGNSVQPDTVSDPENSVQPDTVSGKTVSSRTGNSVQPDTPPTNTPHKKRGGAARSRAAVQHVIQNSPQFDRSESATASADAAPVDSLGGHLDASGRPSCEKHAGMDPNLIPACRGCGMANETARLTEERRREREAAERRRIRDAVDACSDCDPNGWVETDAGMVDCPRHDTKRRSIGAAA